MQWTLSPHASVQSVGKAGTGGFSTVQRTLRWREILGALRVERRVT